ncbi:NO-inducible flavohemoprotein [Bacillus sp. FSL K6-3431]|uniref:NO-inducible flavohemoprotein n=1 Tax=Bacillus sp. FSL K6-3431 TaxID=2921500 RepID=UPI0030FC8FFA
MTLSKKTMDIIKSTVPVLEVHGVTITSVFYKKLFATHPELLHIFNHANQKQGRQQTALANMVYTAAKNIDRLESILPAVKQVAHKHRGLGVKPEHYPIVGENLLESIKEVLGDAATEDIISAWANAYGVIAQVFIDVENEMYVASETQDNGWDGFKNFEIINKQQESDVITSFYMKPLDGMQVPVYKAGQYITVRVYIPGEEYALNRQYSLSCAPGNDFFRISVKKETEFNPNGKVSTYLHEQLSIGDKIEISAPAGDFVLNTEESNPVAFISGGVGLTPMMSMLETLANERSSRTVKFIHSARNESIHAFANEAAAITSQLANGSGFYGYEEPENANGQHHFTGYINEAFLADKITKETVCYVCGPVSFLRSVVGMLTSLGVSKNNIRYEFFGPAIQFESEAVNL